MLQEAIRKREENTCKKAEGENNVQYETNKKVSINGRGKKAIWSSLKVYKTAQGKEN